MSQNNYPAASIGGIFTLTAPASQASTVTGSAVDLAALDLQGNVEITQAVGDVTGTITGKIQDSADGSTGWADISGAAFTAVTAANDTQRLTINATSVRRYIRYVGTIVTGPAVVSVTGSGIPKSV